jgi:hypothetical protein
VVYRNYTSSRLSAELLELRMKVAGSSETYVQPEGTRLNGVRILTSVS